MKLAVGARPIPGTTELLEVLDRVLDGGMVIDTGPRLNAIGFASPGIVTRLIVAGSEPRIATTDGNGRVRGGLLLEEPPAELPRRKHG